MSRRKKRGTKYIFVTGGVVSSLGKGLCAASLGALLEEREPYCIIDGNLADDPLFALRIWDGGMSFHGGFLGVVLAVWYTARKYAAPLGNVADLLAISATVAKGASLSSHSLEAFSMGVFSSF